MERDGLTGAIPQEYVVGVDVGTGSARAGLFDFSGRQFATAVHPIEIYQPEPDVAEHSSRNIWTQVCRAVQDAVKKAGVQPEQVKGISFDATCSLVALDENDEPVSVSAGGDDDHNVIVWMDHRATKEAEYMNGTEHRVLQYVGGKISPEQQPPKLKWLKENLPENWARTRRFFDLSDYLVYQACKTDMRSLCTVVCKWTYLGHEGEFGSWDRSFFESIDLEDLLEPNRIGNDIRPMGTNAGTLTGSAAEELGLTTETVVGVGIIDAHAGGLGSLGASPNGEQVTLPDIEATLALVGGTSSCHMATSPEPRFVPGVWGPYYGAMMPGRWLTEGGQSATGALLDYVIDSHAYSPTLHQEAGQAGVTVYDLLNETVEQLRTESNGEDITADLHLLPDFNGNRSPMADPYSRGMWSGLALDRSKVSLARQYLATIQAIAYGTRQIIEELNDKGYNIARISASGGGTKNPLWMQEHADICGVPIMVARDSDCVILGAAILAAVAAGKFPTIVDAMGAMRPEVYTVEPQRARDNFHKRKYMVFKQLYRDQLDYRKIMND